MAINAKYFRLPGWAAGVAGLGPGLLDADSARHREEPGPCGVKEMTLERTGG